MRTLRLAAATPLAVLGVLLGVFAWRLPMEVGGLVFAPFLLGGAGLCLAGAVALAAPPRPKRPPRTVTPRDVTLLLALLGVLAVAQVVQWIA